MIREIIETPESDAILSAAEFIGIAPERMEAAIKQYNGYKALHKTATKPETVSLEVIERMINDMESTDLIITKVKAAIAAMKPEVADEEWLATEIDKAGIEDALDQTNSASWLISYAQCQRIARKILPKLSSPKHFGLGDNND